MANKVLNCTYTRIHSIHLCSQFKSEIENIIRDNQCTRSAGRPGQPQVVTKLWKGPNWSMYFRTTLRSRGVRCDNWTLYSSVINRGRLHLQLCAVDVESFLVTSCISWGFWLANVSLCLEVRLPPLGLVRNYVAGVINECHLVISIYATSQKLRHTFYI